MRFRIFSFSAYCLSLLLLVMSSSAIANGPQSELDIAEQAVVDFLNRSSNNPSEAQIQLTNLIKGMRGIQVSIFFKTNSAEINKQGKSQIYDISKAMWVYPDPAVRFRLDAYTDVRGSKQYNLKLAQKRLESVLEVFKNALGNDRYDAERFYTGINGENRAEYAQDDEEGMFFDRKVTITLFVQGAGP